MYHYGGQEQQYWYDLGWELPLHSELGTLDQANTVHLDGYEEVVWVGTQRGRLLSYARNETLWAAYSRFNVASKEERVLQILTTSDGVLSLTRSDISFNSRGGIAHPLISPRTMTRITRNGPLAALETFPNHMAQLAAGSEKTLFYLDSIKGELSTFFDLPHSVSKIHASDTFLAIGGANGSLSLVEGRVPRVIATVNAHPLEVTSIASNQQYIYTCGKRQNGADVFLKMFDVRNLKHSIPVSVPSGAVSVQVRPGWSVMILSSFGVWQQGDLFPSANSLRNTEYYKTNCFAPHSPDIDPTVVDWSVSEEMNAMLDSAGIVHFWSCLADSLPRISPLSTSLLVPPVRQVPSFPQPVHNATMAFENMPTRVYSDAVREGLWADEWEPFFSAPTPLRRPLLVLPQVKEHLKQWDERLAVAPNVQGIEYGTLVAAARAAASTSPTRRRIEDPVVDRWGVTAVDYSINHSLFPFALFNKTNRAGLESGLANPMVQILYALPTIKHKMIAHTCDDELCVDCELGNLFASMDAARFSRSKVCQPTRLSRVLSKLKRDLFSVLPVVLGGLTEARNIHSSIVQVRVQENEQVMENFYNGDRLFQLHSVVLRLGTHEVAIVCVPEDLNTAARSRSHSTVSLLPAEVSEDWILFNDFVVTPSCLEEACFRTDKRQPVWAVYVCAEEGTGLESVSPISLEMFCREENLGRGTEKTFVPLSEKELEQLVRGELVVALDTEFVAIGLASMEIREDGSKEIGRPGDMTVGRVSVLRVCDDPEMDGVPFIDHYIAMDESDIKDYVTRFSGIRAGDLDPKCSTHWLTSSKAMHQKLRFLIDCGTKFVGHGLHTDFRILNLWVPQSALIDTVDLFHLRGQRFLSLKFLANRLLEKSIQGDVHCSIEDAKTALDIYRVYLKLEKEGTVESTIKSLYESGRTLGWR